MEIENKLILEQKLSDPFYKKEIFKWSISLIFPILIIFFGKNSSLSKEALLFFAITIWGILSWCLVLLPEPITGLLLPILYIVFKVAPPNVVLSPWTTTIPWLILSASTMALMLNKTGIAKRISLLSIKTFGKSFKTILIGITLAGLALGPLIPSVMAKTIIICIIATSICQMLDFKAKSKESTAIFLGAFFSVTAFRYAYLTGDSSIPMISNMAEKVSGKPISWGQYFIENAPVAFAYGIISILLVMYGIRGVKEINDNDRKIISKKYEELGRFSSDEKKGIAIMIFTLLMMITESYHKINVAWMMVIISTLFFFPKINLLKKEDLPKINLVSLLFVVGAMTIGSAASKTGAVEFMKDMMKDYFVGGPAMITSFIYVIGTIQNFFLTPLAALASFTMPLMSLGQELGINPYVITYIYQYSLDQYLLPYEFAPLLFAYAEGYIDMKIMIKILALRMILGLVIIVGVAIPWWNYLGVFFVKG